MTWTIKSATFYGEIGQPETGDFAVYVLEESGPGSGSSVRSYTFGFDPDDYANYGLFKAASVRELKAIRDLLNQSKGVSPIDTT